MIQQNTPEVSRRSTYTVCHTSAKTSLRAAASEKYFCSTKGCVSTETTNVRVVGSYEDSEMCSRVASILDGDM